MLIRIVAIVVGMFVLAFLVGPSGVGAPSAAPSAGPERAPTTSPAIIQVRPVSYPLDAQLDMVLPKVQFQKAPLHEAIHWLRSRADLNVVVDYRGIESAGIDLNAPVDLDLKSVAVGDVLTVLLFTNSVPTAALRYEMRGNIVVITTSEKLAGDTVVKVYDIADIILAERERQRVLYPFTPNPAATQPNPSPNDRREPKTSEEIVEDLTRLIQDSVMPDDWRETGGMYGSIKELSGRLIIDQRRDGHRQIEVLLAAIRETGRLPGK
jgi:hypothetical protein